MKIGEFENLKMNFEPGYRIKFDPLLRRTLHRSEPCSTELPDLEVSDTTKDDSRTNAGYLIIV